MRFFGTMQRKSYQQKAEDIIADARERFNTFTLTDEDFEYKPVDDIEVVYGDDDSDGQ